MIYNLNHKINFRNDWKKFNNGRETTFKKILNFKPNAKRYVGRPTLRFNDQQTLPENGTGQKLPNA